MEENRSFFRIKNEGRIKASYDDRSLYVIDISPSGAHIIAKNVPLKKDGLLEIVINHFMIEVNYKLLKRQGDDVIVAFKLEKEINRLLSALKNIRDSLDSTISSAFIDKSSPDTPLDFLEPPITPILEIFTKLDSVYAIRFYQLINQYVKDENNLISLVTIRHALGVDRMKSYLSYRLLKKNILEPAKKQINEKTDLTVTYSEVLEGKKVVALKFILISIVL